MVIIRGNLLDIAGNSSTLPPALEQSRAARLEETRPLLRLDPIHHAEAGAMAKRTTGRQTFSHQDQTTQRPHHRARRANAVGAALALAAAAALTPAAFA